MFKFKLLCVFLFLHTAVNAGDIIYTTTDSLIVEKIIAELSADKPIATLVVEAGKALLGTPYVGQTLENGKEERLVINLRELDCTTFAENCLAFALTVKSELPDFNTFVQKIEKIRYRNEIRNGYLSRLHYFSEWIRENNLRGHVKEPLSMFGEPFRIQVNFMSTHPNSYPVLKENPALVPLLAEQEKALASLEYFFLKKENIRSNEKMLKEGDIVGLTTSIAGLDVTHVGILIKVEGRIHLLHASSDLEKVVISDEPLYNYLQKKKSHTGIILARPE